MILIRSCEDVNDCFLIEDQVYTSYDPKLREGCIRSFSELEHYFKDMADNYDDVISKLRKLKYV